MRDQTILVVEDEIGILENIVEALEIEGFTVHGTNSGRESIQIAKQHQPDLILCDINMPEFNGYDVLMTVRNDAMIATTPFIFLTALAGRPAMRRGMELGADDYLTKPFTPMELLTAVNTRLEKHGQIIRQNQEKLDRLRHNIIHALPHELRTPLTGLIGCADFLIMDYEHIDRENLLNIAQVMMRSATRLERLIENYLVYAQIELATYDPERITLMLSSVLEYPNVLIQTITHDVADKAERTADLKVSTEPAILNISDENFNKIIWELVENAFKFSRTGSDVKVDACVDGKNYVITISDQGRGMSAEDIADIGAYVQFNRALHEQQGLGLGLIIALRLTEMHNGSFAIQSVVNQGTTITLRFPLGRVG
ncbi:MAG: response regulator [Anaerolineae bacterium]